MAFAIASTVHFIFFFFCFLAAYRGTVEIVRCSIREFVEVTAQDYNGEAPLKRCVHTSLTSLTLLKIAL